MECLSKIIGVTNSDCPCLIDGLTPEEKAALKESTSGLYMDELEGGLSMSGITMLDACKNFAQMSLAARDTAVKKINADVLAAMAVKYKSGKPAFIGYIGRPSYAGTLQASHQYQFMRLTPVELSDAVMKVTGLKIIVDRGAILTVQILSVPKGGNQGTVVLSENVQTTANTYTTIPLPNGGLSLPLSLNGSVLEYYVIWDRNVAGGVNPKDLTMDCNCGVSGNGFGEYLRADGGQLTDLNLLNTVVNRDNYSHGITMDVELRCVPGNLICREFSKENAIAITMAWAVMYKAGELLIEAALGSNQVNRYTMMNREYLWGKRNHFRKEYDTRIQYLTSVMDVSSTDCYICRETKMFLVGIQA